MNVIELQKIIVESCNQAISSGQTKAGEAITILECTKLEIYLQMKAIQAMQAKLSIIPASNIRPLR